MFEADGVTPLPDTDSDTVPDTGALAHSGGSVNIVVKVTIGWDTTNDTTTVTATSNADGAVSAAATDTTTGLPTITITDTTADFGTNLDPTGPSSNSTDGVSAYTSSSGNQGAYYVWRSDGGSGVTVTVKSNKPWNGTTSATENGGTSPSMTVASGVWRYTEGTQPASYADCTAATAFTIAASPWKSGISAGINGYVHYYCLRVDWIDDPGTILSTLTYQVSQL